MNTTTTPTDIQSLIGQQTSSEYLYQEQERELMEAAASDFDGYSEWSEDVENFFIADGRVHHKPQPQSNGRVGSIEI